MARKAQKNKASGEEGIGLQTHRGMDADLELHGRINACLQPYTLFATSLVFLSFSSRR